ncbi:MAG: MurR/RpiR family transcriptional regulator [Spirochaetia bacterium]
MNDINALTKIKSLYPDITQAERRIADFILAKPEEIYRITINEMAGITDVSLPTVYRFAKRLGFKGYKDFKVALIRDIGVGFHFSPDAIRSDGVEAITKSLFDKEIAHLQETAANLDYSAVEAAAKLIVQAERILFFSVSSSISTTMDFAWKLSLAGFTCCHNPDIYYQRILAKNSRESDVAVGVSFSGRTGEVLSCMENAKKNGTKTICLTSFMDAPITGYSDVKLISAPVEAEYQKIDLPSKISHTVILDAVYLYILLKEDKRAAENISKAEHELLMYRK